MMVFEVRTGGRVKTYVRLGSNKPNNTGLGHDDSAREGDRIRPRTANGIQLPVVVHKMVVRD